MSRASPSDRGIRQRTRDPARGDDMRSRTLIAASLLALGGTGCGGARTSYVRSPDTVLGRVVIYRNGVAYFERSATVEGDTLRLAVPAERVDDFLRSLTVVDADTGQPAPVP